MKDLLQEIRDMKLLEAYRLRALRAWDKFDKLHDKLFSQLGDVVSEADVSAAETFAILMQRSYFTQYYMMGDCTCKPDSAMACDVCQAQIKAKSIYREEM